MRVEEIVSLVKSIGTPQEVIDHMFQVNHVAMHLVDAGIAAGREVDRDIVQEACLTHDIGIPRLSQEFVPIPEYGPNFKVEVDHIMHIIYSTEMVRELGFSESVQLCVLRHMVGPSRSEWQDLGLPPWEKEAIPENDNEGLMAFSDSLVWMARTGNNPWSDPEAPVKATWPFLNVIFEHHAGHGIDRDHPFVQRFIPLTNRWLPLIQIDCLPVDLKAKMQAMSSSG